MRRFFGSLRLGAPSEVDSLWAASHLLPAESELWFRLSNADRRHTITVARTVMDQLGEAHRPVVAAALLHDVGKLVSGFGPVGRVLATLIGTFSHPTLVTSWAGSSGFRRRIADYLRHPEEGAALLSAVGSDPFTVAWVNEHHRPRCLWTVDPLLGQVLSNADDD